jgi:hypothetical protein
MSKRTEGPFRVDTEAITPRNGVEYKVTIAPSQAAAVRELLRLTDGKAERADIRFYDTPQLELSRRGIVLRSRAVHDGPDDVTVKLRPVDPSRVDARWFSENGFKVETDKVGERGVTSASLTESSKRGRIADVDEGKRGLASLFTGDQERLLAELGGQPVDFDALSILGPVEARKWRLSPKDGPGPLAVDEWTLPDGRQVLEVSIRAAQPQSEEAARALSDYLDAHGIHPASNQETKTKAALDYFAQHPRRPGQS